MSFGLLELPWNGLSAYLNDSLGRLEGLHLHCFKSDLESLRVMMSQAK